jgi:hypothetical protein
VRRPRLPLRLPLPAQPYIRPLAATSVQRDDERSREAALVTWQVLPEPSLVPPLGCAHPPRFRFKVAQKRPKDSRGPASPSLSHSLSLRPSLPGTDPMDFPQRGLVTTQLIKHFLRPYWVPDQCWIPLSIYPQAPGENVLLSWAQDLFSGAGR